MRGFKNTPAGRAAAIRYEEHLAAERAAEDARLAKTGRSRAEAARARRRFAAMDHEGAVTRKLAEQRERHGEPPF